MSDRSSEVWPGSYVHYELTSTRRRVFSLERPGYFEDASLGDSEDEARETLDTLISHADLAAIAAGIAEAMVSGFDLDQRVRFYKKSRRCTIKGTGDELSVAILDALPEGWTVRGAWWSPPDAPQTVAEMRRELEELKAEK
jgi:hypothetical protein